jgi:hypothetical protein
MLNRVRSTTIVTFQLAPLWKEMCTCDNYSLLYFYLFKRFDRMLIIYKLLNLTQNST